jgi:hypothetical protein
LTRSPIIAPGEYRERGGDKHLVFAGRGASSARAGVVFAQRQAIRALGVVEDPIPPER